ncbi:ATP-binding protein [Actinoplanes sp. NPDC049265]|uniref:sensor histidine kinase n=1 Tax=Actinoplanes sp. NPDC049265 TaxID=3363902 RepID=UPI00371CBE8E
MRRRSMLVLVAVVLLGLLGTVLAVAALRRGDQNRAAQTLSERTQTVVETVSAEIRRYGEALRDVTAAVSAQAELDADEFAAIVAPVDRSRLPGATGVSLIVAAGTGQIPQVQARWRARGAAGLTLQPAPRATSHWFTVFVHPLDGSAPSVGRDLAPATAAVRTLELSRQTRQLTASQPYLFLKDAHLPPDQQQLSTVLAAPVYATSRAAPDVGQFRGWIVLGVRGGDFLRQSIGVVARDTVTVTLRDTAADGRQIVLAAWTPPGVTVEQRTSRTTTVEAPQRQWQLRVSATDKLLPETAVQMRTAAWVTGAVLTLLLAILAATVTTSRDRLMLSVEEATAALREDIARRTRVEEQLRRREQELVGFAGVVAHDLRGPLARISAYSDFLREEAAPAWNDEHRGFLERLRGGATRMQSLLDDLLDYATADNRPLTSVPVDLQAIVTDIVAERVIAPTDGTVVVGPLPTVTGDPTLLRQVFDNLIGNACKYTRAGQAPQVEVTAQGDEQRGRWRIEVSDHGIGIPDEQRAEVFTAFTRASGSETYTGTGLGLAIVHRIVERHHGAIDVVGNRHGGSTFRVVLPATVPAARAWSR